MTPDAGGGGGGRLKSKWVASPGSFGLVSMYGFALAVPMTRWLFVDQNPSGSVCLVGVPVSS